MSFMNVDTVPLTPARQKAREITAVFPPDAGGPSPRGRSTGLADLKERLDLLRDHYAALRREQQDAQTYYDGTFKFIVPDGVTKVIPATGRVAVDIPASHMITDKPRVKRRRDLHGQRRQAHDDRVEAFLQAWLSHAEHMLPTPPLHEASRLQLKRGEVALIGPCINLQKFLNDCEAGWAYYEAEDPLCVYLDDSPEPQEMFLVHERTVGWLMQRAREDPKLRRFDPGTRKLNEVVTHCEWYGYQGQSVYYASWEEQGDEFLVSPRPEGRVRIPERHAYSGYGQVTPGAKPEDRAVSIYNRQVKDLLVDQALARTLLTAGLATGIWERYWITPGEQGQQMMIDYAPGSRSVKPEKAQPIPPAAVPQVLMANLDHINADLEVALYSGVLRGEAASGSEPASRFAMRLGTARVKFGPPLRMLEAAMSQLCYDFGVLLERLSKATGKTEFTIAGRTVSIQDFGGDYECTVDLLAEDPEEQARRVALGANLDGKISKKRIFEDYMGIENAEEEFEQMQYEALIFSPEFQQTLAESIGVIRQQGQLAQAGRGGTQQASGGFGGMEALAQLNAQARLMRATRVGQSQMPGRPGSVEAMAQGMQQIAAPGMGGAGA